MLQLIRDKATGWIAWVIVILISIPFALWGIQEYVSPDVNPAVVSVNGDDIDYRTFYSNYQRRLATFRNILPENEIDETVIRKQSLDELINQQLLVQAALDGKMRIGDELLASMIRQNDRFQRDGSFSPDLYQNFLRINGFSPGGFEFEMRRDLLSGQILAAIRNTAIVSGAEVKAAVDLRTQVRKFTTLEIPGARFKKEELSDQAVQSYFDSHRELYRQPELLTIEYVQISRAELAKGISASEAGLRELYERNLASGVYSTQEQRRARHILITVPPNADSSVEQLALEKIQSLRKRITEGGEPFEALAKAESEDSGSASAGGDLGQFGQGVMDPAFEAAAFQLDVGVISEPVRTRFGWHLIEVTEGQPTVARSFEETREEILREYQNAEAERLFSDRAEQLANLSFERPDTLAPAAEALGIEIKTAPAFSREDSDAAGIARFEQVREHAFRTNVIDGENSELIETEPGVVVVLRVTNREPSRLRELDEVRTEVVNAVQNEIAAAASREFGESLLEKLKRGEDAKVVAEGVSLEWSEPQTVARQTGTTNATLRDALFKLPKPQPGRSEYIGLDAEDGGFQIVRLIEVDQYALGEDEKGRLSNAVADGLRAQYGRAAEEALLKAMKDDAEITIFQDRLAPSSL